MPDDTIELFGFPAVRRKKVVAAFDGGRITSDGGVMLLAAAERRMGIAQRLASLIADPRNPLLVTHSIPDILRARMLAIACGYEDADDLDHLRTDPGFKLACGRLPDSGGDLCSQPTMSRWENAPNLREVVRLTYAMVDIYCASYCRPPAAVTLDIDDTVDVVHGHQQLSLFNAHYDERCFLPIHVYDTAASRPVAMLLRPGKTPSGDEVHRHLRRLVRRIRSHWPTTRLTIRGDGHYGRPEVMAWCEANSVDFILGLPGNAVLSRLVEIAADDVRVRRAEAEAEIVRRYTKKVSAQPGARTDWPRRVLPDCLICVDATPGGGSDDGADGGEQVGAPVGAEAAGDLAICRGRTQFAFAAVVVGGDLGMIEEGEQVVADLGVSLAQSLAVAIDRRQRHDGIERAFQTAAVFAPRAVGQTAVSPRQHHGAQQQRLHARGEHRVARVDGILAIAQLVGEADLPRSAWPCCAP